MFQSGDQVMVRRLVLEGLGEHFGFIDETMNPDIDDIAASFAQGVFLVALDGDEIVGTGGLLPVDASRARIVRMSTRASHRRRGVGRAVLSSLLEQARSLGYGSVVLATDAAWIDVIAFYDALGFRRLDGPPGTAVFAMELGD